MIHTKFASRFIVLLSLSLAIVNCGKNTEQHKQTRAQDYIQRAESYRQQGQYRAAIIEISNALQQNPGDRTATLKYADILNELGQGKAALKLLEPLAGQSNRNEALATAQAYIAQRKYQSAIDYLSANSARLNLRSDGAANLLKARAQLGLNQTAPARETLLALNPEDMHVGLEIIRLNWQAGNIADSKNALEKLLQKYPDNVDVLIEAARQAEAGSELARSEDLLSKALMNLPATDILTPQKAETLQRLITTLTKLGRSNEALVYSKTLADANPEGMALQDKLKQAVELFQAGKLADAEPLLLEIYNESHNETVGTMLGMIRFSKNDLNGAANYLTTNADPETTSKDALTALAATQLELSQPNKLLEIFDAKERARIASPELKVLIGIALLQTGATTEGEKLIEEAQHASPNNPSLFIAAARSYLQSGQPLKAIATLQRAPRNKSDTSVTRALIASHLAAGQNEPALAAARQLTADAPNDAQSWWVLGSTALRLRQIDIADKALRKSTQLQPDYTPARIELAKLSLLRKQPNDASTQYRNLLAQNPANIDALKGFIVSLLSQGERFETVEQQLLTLANNASARATLAAYYLQGDRYADAQRLLQSVGDTNNEYIVRIKQLAAWKGAALALQQRDFDSARSRALDGMKISPQNIEFMVMLARIEQAAGKLDEAKKIANRFSPQQRQNPLAQELFGDLAMLDRHPQDASAYYRQAWNLTHSDAIATKLYKSLSDADQDAAAKWLQQWREQNPKSDAPYLLTGVRAQRAGNGQEAIAAYETAIARNPNNAHALNNLALLYQEKNDSRALSTAARAYEIAAQDPAVLDTYGWLLAKNRQREKGLELLRKAETLAPDSQEIKQHLHDADIIER